MHRQIGMIAAVVTGTALFSGSLAQAGTEIQFDPNGDGSDIKDVATFDFLPGNMVFDKDSAGDTEAVQYAHSKLGSLVDGDGNVVSAPGLNDTYEITVVSAFNATVTQASSSIDEFGLASTQSTNRLRMFFDDTPDADNLTGGGFHDGTLIYEGSVADAAGSFFDFGTTVRFDQSGNDNYGGKQSVDGSGSIKLTSDVGSTDSAFFVSQLLQQLKFNTSSITPFEQVNPSAEFNDQTVTPNLGSVNGDGEDMQLQSDSNASTVVIPEPASLTLLAPAGLALLRRRRR